MRHGAETLPATGWDENYLSGLKCDNSQDSGFLEYDATSLASYFPRFRTVVIPSSSQPGSTATQYHNLAKRNSAGLR